MEKLDDLDSGYDVDIWDGPQDRHGQAGVSGDLWEGDQRESTNRIDGEELRPHQDGGETLHRRHASRVVTHRTGGWRNVGHAERGVDRKVIPAGGDGSCTHRLHYGDSTC